MLNEALRLLRVFNDRKATDLAKELGISAAYLSEIETGKKTPSMELVDQYAKVFHTKPSSILFFSEEIQKISGTKKIAYTLIQFLKYIENLDINQKCI